MNTERLPQIHKVLEMLNEWELNYGTTYGANAGLSSSGESNARIADLKNKLRELGAVFQWDGTQYVLIETVEPGSGYQMADRADSAEPTEEQAAKPCEEK